MAEKIIKRATAIGGQGPSNEGKKTIEMEQPYRVSVTIKGTVPFLYNKWNCESVEAKTKASKGSRAKKTTDLETLVYRASNGELAISGESFRQSLIAAAKFKQDPRSSRKTAADLYKAGLTVLTEAAPTGKDRWDYEDKRRAVVKGNGISRVRPALEKDWEATFEILVGLPEYISTTDLNEVIALAGRTVGIGDFRPTFGKFQVIHFELLD